jgi:hypothetical protein
MGASFTDWMSFTTGLVTVIGIFIIYHQVKINRKQLYLATISRCTERFVNFGDLHNTINEKDIHNYIELVNEELFYFQYKYLPKEIAYEWLDGMLDYLPLTNKQGVIINSHQTIMKSKDERHLYLKDFPRIKHTFTLRGDYDLDIIYDTQDKNQDIRIATRNVIVDELYDNITVTFNKIHYVVK